MVGRAGVRERQGPRPRRVRRRALLGTRLTRRGVVVPLVLLLAALAALTARYVVWPRTDAPARADALVVLGGGGDERRETALHLLERGFAPILVVSHGPPSLCGSARVRCFVPEPDRTQGEARAAAELAARHGWRRILVVTSRYHAVRAERLFRRCFDGEVRVIGARPTSPAGLPSAANVVREWGGWAHALLVERGC